LTFACAEKRFVKILEEKHIMHAVIMEQGEDGKAVPAIKSIDDSELPAGNVTIATSHTTINYKDGLAMSENGGGVVRDYPHVPGVDLAGIVEHSDDPRYKVGDAVVSTGWRVGEVHWGGFATKARLNADWLVPLPAGLSAKHAMAVGTAGLTSMLGILALEMHGLTPEKGPVLVTGAAGGVGSVAVAVLANLGYEVAAVTGRPEQADYLKSLGATTIVARGDINEASKRPLEKEMWAGCIDAVGGEMLARILGQMKYGGSVASVGLAGGTKVPASVIPFLLRGVNILGIDSVMTPFDKRQIAWKRLARDLPIEKLEAMIQPASLEDVPALGEKILKGQIKGRVVIEL
jgi:acrylyl-CoA reductase (NADPH)